MTHARPVSTYGLIMPSTWILLAVLVGFVARVAPAHAGQPPSGCGGRAPTIVGTPDDDVLTGTSGDDVIITGGGGDRVRGLDGVDYICTQSGRDAVRGGSGGDRVYGGRGADLLRGGPGREFLRGQAGRDALYGGSFADSLNGGSGVDWCGYHYGDSVQDDNFVSNCEGLPHDLEATSCRTA
jgi:Ca2+-binding RTX toxin-like protein